MATRSKSSTRNTSSKKSASKTARAAGARSSAQTGARSTANASVRRASASTSVSDLAPKKSIFAAAGVAAIAGAAYFFRHELMGLVGYQRIQMSDDVRSKLPMAKNLQTISDFDGNYDMDGVSFDTEGVVVGSDRQFQTQPQV